MEISQTPHSEWFSLSAESEADFGDLDTSDYLTQIGPHLIIPPRQLPEQPRDLRAPGVPRIVSQSSASSSQTRRSSISFWQSPGSPPINLTSPLSSGTEHRNSLATQPSAPGNLQLGVSSEPTDSGSATDPQGPTSDLLPTNSTSFSVSDSELGHSPDAEFWSSLVNSSDSPTWNYSFEEYIDLTEDSPPPEMPVPVSVHTTPARSTRSDRTHSTARATGGYGSEEGSLSTPQSRPSKRRKVERGLSPQLKIEIEEVDLVDVDDDTKLSNALQEEAIRSQQAAADRPAKLSDLQCVICLEKLTDITVTKCGHVFCHTCLMEALIAGERIPGHQGKAGGKCPICRTSISRPKTKNQKQPMHVIPLEIKVMSKKEWAKGKAKAAIGP